MSLTHFPHHKVALHRVSDHTFLYLARWEELCITFWFWVSHFRIKTQARSNNSDTGSMPIFSNLVDYHHLGGHRPPHLQSRTALAILMTNNYYLLLVLIHTVEKFKT